MKIEILVTPDGKASIQTLGFPHVVPTLGHSRSISWW